MVKVKKQKNVKLRYDQFFHSRVVAIICIFKGTSSLQSHHNNNKTTRCMLFLYWIWRGKNSVQWLAYNNTIYVNVYTWTHTRSAITVNDLLHLPHQIASKLLLLFLIFLLFFGIYVYALLLRNWNQRWRAIFIHRSTIYEYYKSIFSQPIDIRSECFLRRPLLFFVIDPFQISELAQAYYYVN